jgi:hypothetical protein
MKRAFTLLVVAVVSGVSPSHTQQPAPAPETQSWIGTISDSLCAGSHPADPRSMTSRECIFECIKKHARFVLLDGSGQVLTIANQDLPGLPLYAGRPVRLLGELRGEAIAATRVEAYPPHLHMLHVMTNWRDTPGGVGFLIAAMSEARVAVTHAKLAAANPDDLAGMKLHTGHVLNALDPAVEPKGPAAGYGVKKGVDGAQQHLGFAINAEGASSAMKAHASQVLPPLADVDKRTIEAMAVGQRVRAVATAAEAAPLVGQLGVLTTQVAEGLAQAHTHMMLMLKGEGLENAPR